MKKFFITSAFLFISLIASKELSAQQADKVKPDDVKERQILFYSRVLSVDQDLANKVNQIQDDFKSSVKSVTAEPGLSEESKRSKVDLLVANKINKLQALLTSEQLKKIVPSTELDKVSQLKKAPDATN